MADVAELSFEKAWRAVEKVQQRLLRAVKALDAAGVPFAVVGGNAVAVWVGSVDEGAVRNTKDVDILLERENLQAASEAMASADFIPEEVNGVSMFLDKYDPMPSRGVHVLFAGEKLRPYDPHPVPVIGNIKRSAEGVPAVGLIELLILKLQAWRRIDQVHIADLVKVGLVDNNTVSQVPADLRPRLQEILADPNG